MDRGTAERVRAAFHRAREAAGPLYVTLERGGIEARVEAPVPCEEWLLELLLATRQGDIPAWLGDPDYPERRAIRLAYRDGFTHGWLAAEEARITLGELLDGLEPHQQRILLWIYEGRSYEEMRDALGLSTTDGVQYHVREAARRRGMTMRQLRAAIIARRRDEA